MPFSKVLVKKWTSESELGSNSNTTISQTSTLATSFGRLSKVVFRYEYFIYVTACQKTKQNKTLNNYRKWHIAANPFEKKIIIIIIFFFFFPSLVREMTVRETNNKECRESTVTWGSPPLKESPLRRKKKRKKKTHKLHWFRWRQTGTST